MQGGAVLAIGGANKADWARKSQLIGVGNTLTGASSAVSEYNMINGYKNEVTNATHTSIIGSNNKAKNIQSTIVMGDNNTLEGRKNVISLGNKNTVVVDDAVAIGNGTTVSAESGVAIGVDSVADRVAGSEKGALGAFAPANIPTTEKSTWTSTKGAVSVGDTANDITRQITNVAAGSEDTDAVNVAQLKQVASQAERAKTTVSDGTNTTVTSTVAEDGHTDYKVNLNKDLLLGDITGKNVSISGTNGTIETTGSIATKDKIYAANGAKLADIDITGDTISNDKSSVKLDKNGTVTINGKVSVNQDGKVSGVAAGDISEKSTDAVNGSQLFATSQQVAQNAQSINKLGNRINKVGAGAAALAALHPLDFDPDDKWDFVAGYGNYNGENAAAIGAYYRPNEDTMFSVGGSFGNGENMMNAGVSLKLGQGNHVSTSKVAMAKEIKDLRKEMEGLKSALLDANAGKKLDTSKLQLFPDVPKNHWAYEYVSTLKGNGALTGYPDGEFKGDRPMTRYEFATMLYKAMLEGATLSDKILKEFAPELERFTVDTVHQDKDGKPTVERVRTVKAEK